MRCGNVSSSTARAILLAGTVLLIFSACAPVPWSTIIEDERRQSIESNYRRFAAAQNQCLSGWDADVVVNWKSSLNEYAFLAYLQVLPPSFFKLVISNPLGQPLKLLATDGTYYRYIDVIDHSFIYGSTRSWALRYDLPYTVARRSWPDWLQGRPDGGKERLISEIRADGEGRGVWLTIIDREIEQDPADGELIVEKEFSENPEEETLANDEAGSAPGYPVYEHLLIDGESGIVKQQIIVDQSEKPQATISYNEWQQTGSCLYPADIEITGLPYRATIHLELSRIQQSDVSSSDFIINIPPGFSRTMMP